MATQAIEADIVKQKLGKIPKNELAEINDFVDFIIEKKLKKPNNPVKLKGLWKGKGFSKIKDLDKEIENLRKDSSLQILKKFS